VVSRRRAHQGNIRTISIVNADFKVPLGYHQGSVNLCRCLNRRHQRHQRCYVVSLCGGPGLLLSFLLLSPLLSHPRTEHCRLSECPPGFCVWTTRASSADQCEITHSAILCVEGGSVEMPWLLELHARD